MGHFRPPETVALVGENSIVVHWALLFEQSAAELNLGLWFVLDLIMFLIRLYSLLHLW